MNLYNSFFLKYSVLIKPLPWSCLNFLFWNHRYENSHMIKSQIFFSCYLSDPHMKLNCLKLPRSFFFLCIRLEKGAVKRIFYSKNHVEVFMKLYFLWIEIMLRKVCSFVLRILGQKIYIMFHLFLLRYFLDISSTSFISVLLKIMIVYHMVAFTQILILWIILYC